MKTKSDSRPEDFNLEDHPTMELHYQAIDQAHSSRVDNIQSAISLAALTCDTDEDNVIVEDMGDMNWDIRVEGCMNFSAKLCAVELI